MSAKQAPSANDTCGCCEGTEGLTPLPTANRPGLDALRYRVGTHAAFLETMLARLSSQDYPALRDLTTRQPGDPAIALLDAWATVADVLTFYNERLANEGYLRTATERRSVLELARLIGYTPRPGVAASVYLAYTLDENSKEEVVIPLGARVQSVPGPGELPQTFETSAALHARARLNNLKPRLTRPQTKVTIQTSLSLEATARVYLQGINTNLKANDMLLIDFEPAADRKAGPPIPYRVVDVQSEPLANRTLVLLRDWQPTSQVTPAGSEEQNPPPISTFQEMRVGELLDPLTTLPSRPPANQYRLQSNLATAFGAKADAPLQLLRTFQPSLRDTLSTAVANAQVTPVNSIKVYAMRVKASLFGYNAQKKQKLVRTLPDQGGNEPTGTPDTGTLGISLFMAAGTPPVGPQTETTETVIIGEWPTDEKPNVIYLDAAYDKILPKSWVVVDASAVPPDDDMASVKPINCLLVTNAKAVQAGIARAEYGISGKSTRIELKDPWIEITGPDTSPSDQDFQVIRRTVVYTQNEELPLAEEQVEDPICGNDGYIELDGLYDDLHPGRWLIVSGERDIAGTSGVRDSELVMLAAVTHAVAPPLTSQEQPTNTAGNAQSNGNGPAVSGSEEDTSGKPPEQEGLAGDKKHTYLQLAAAANGQPALAYCYKRDTVTIYGNVVKATHGETRSEVLGSGDGSRAFQVFTLKQSPLTHVAAVTPTGVASTLEVRVNDVQWHEVNSLDGQGPTDRNFITKTDDEGKTTVLFGNGQQGVRPPTGIENVKARYRNGIGKLGNVKAAQLSLLMTRPLGVKDVINPLPATGGADKESRDQARQNAPLALMALDRLVSVRDYEDFARIFAGIGKASAARLSDGQRQVVHVTVAGADDIPIDEDSDLVGALRRSLRDFGDPYQPIQVAVRELLLIVLSVRVRVLPDYQWETVAPKIRTALLDALGFNRRALGQDVLLSEVISAIQSVAGVAYVDVDTLDTVTYAELQEFFSQEVDPPLDLLAFLEQRHQSTATLQPLPRIPVELARQDTTQAHGIAQAQLAILTPEVPDTLILTVIED